MGINVEYNQLDPLLRAAGYSDGDVNNESGYSPFPGNINQVISYITFDILFFMYHQYSQYAFSNFLNAKYYIVMQWQFVIIFENHIVFLSLSPPPPLSLSLNVYVMRTS